MPDVAFKLRSNTEEGWNSYKYVLLKNEVILDTTNNRLKVGDGKSKFSELEYVDQPIDNLTTEDKYRALSAKQGVVLKNLLNTKADQSALDSLSNTVTNNYNSLSSTIISSKVSVVNALNSSDTNSALSANMGKRLNDMLSKTEEWTFTLENGSTVTKKVILS